MSSKLLFAIALALGAMHGQASGVRQGQPRPKPQPPLSRAELTTTINRVGKLLTQVLTLEAPIPAMKQPSAPSKPASREEVIEQFGRLFRSVSHRFRIKPRPVAFLAKEVRVAGPVLPTLRLLVEWGCVAPVGPLATGPASGLTLAEYGDALGFFLARVAELTHTPSRKFTPYLTPIR